MRPTVPARTLALALGLAALGTSAARSAAAQGSFAPAPTAGAVASAPMPAALAAWVGVYRVSLTKGQQTIPLRVVMERVGVSLDGTVMVGTTTSALANVRSSEQGELRAVMLTSEGQGELVLRATATGIVGTLKIGKQTWAVTGERSA